MWLYTNQGHLSVVEDKNDRTRVVVRARNLDALAAFSDYSVYITPKADYKYRVNISKNHFEQWFINYVQTMNYTNFKDNLYTVGMGEEERMVFYTVYQCALKLEEIDD